MRTYPFFEALPYDIRGLIYTYLEPDEQLPFFQGFGLTSSGFLLSCRLANFELCEIAAARIVRCIPVFKAQFEKLAEIDCDLHLSHTPAKFRNAKINLPFTALDHELQSNGLIRWRREVLMGLHPLFAAYFNTVQIHFDGTKNGQALNTLLERGKAEVKMHHLLRDLAYMLERVNKVRDGISPCLDTIFHDEPGVQLVSYPASTPAVRTRRICLSWDLRQSQTRSQKDAVLLNGKKHTVITTSIETDTQESCGPSFYQLRDETRHIGEFDLESESRWKNDDIEKLNVALNAVSTRSTYCHSNGPGEDVLAGLRNVEERDYEDQEAEITALLWDT